MIRQAILFCLFACFVAGCGYRFEDPDCLCGRYRTIAVPLVCGDIDGRLTNTIVRRLSGSGLWQYKECTADLTLKIEVICCDQRNIGYQLDRVRCLDDKDQGVGPPLGTAVDRLLPNEGRFLLGLELCLVERRSGKAVYGPTRVTADIDYDHNPLTTDTRLSVFSLGEFVNIDQAQDIARAPLYEELAQKVVDLLSGACI